MNNETLIKPNLQQRLFWDVDFDEIDFEMNADFVITRAFERGDVSDIRQTRRFYGDDKVIQSLISAKSLLYHTFVFAKNIFNLKENDFRCYILNQSKPMTWTY